MPVSDEYVEYVVDQLEFIGPITAKRMFGGVGLYYDGVFFGLIAGDRLYFKVDDGNRQRYIDARARAFQPYGDDSYSMSYYEVPVTVLEDVDQLARWAREAVAAAERKAATIRKARKKG